MAWGCWEKLSHQQKARFLIATNTALDKTVKGNVQIYSHLAAIEEVPIREKNLYN